MLVSIAVWSTNLDKICYELEKYYFSEHNIQDSQVCNFYQKQPNDEIYNQKKLVAATGTQFLRYTQNYYTVDTPSLTRTSRDHKYLFLLKKYV